MMLASTRCFSRVSNNLNLSFSRSLAAISDSLQSVRNRRFCCISSSTTTQLISDPVEPRTHFHHHSHSIARPSTKCFSRFSANNIMTGSDTFRISDYDIVGFDLDNTLLRYNVAAMVELEFKSLVQYLVDQKGYSPKHLLKPMSDDLDFLQKGLIIDLKRGNILKVSPNGFIRSASHGTRQMDDAEICSVYGEQRMWDLLVEYTKNLLSTWNGPASDSMRSLLDYFDMPSSLVFARCVDTLDEANGGASETYEVWPDVLDGLITLYRREWFQTNESPYFEALKTNLDKYVYESDPKVIEYLKELRKTKTTFLLTGSHLDFANLTAGRALGADWKDLFDFVVCFGKKPGFFIENERPFYKLDGLEDTETVELKDIQLDQVYTQGNMRYLLEVLKRKPNSVADPKVLYVGDNLIQDVYTPFAKLKIDTIAVCEELVAEGYKNSEETHVDAALLTSKRWGSYFGTSCDPTLWTEIIRSNAKLCVADVAVLAKNPLDFEYKCFTHEKSCVDGFYPADPKNF